jgi:hypothetical protein
VFYVKIRYLYKREINYGRTQKLFSGWNTDSDVDALFYPTTDIQASVHRRTTYKKRAVLVFRFYLPSLKLHKMFGVMDRIAGILEYSNGVTPFSLHLHFRAYIKRLGKI